MNGWGQDSSQGPQGGADSYGVLWPSKYCGKVPPEFRRLRPGWADPEDSQNLEPVGLVQPGWWLVDIN